MIVEIQTVMTLEEHRLHLIFNGTPAEKSRVARQVLDESSLHFSDRDRAFLLGIPISALHQFADE